MSWLRRNKSIVILGSGPAAMFAAHAAVNAGHTPRIYSRPGKSTMYGAQYLHGEIPGLDCGQRETINYVLKGTVDGYRNKVYGEGSNVEVSPVTLAPQHDAWNIRSAYDDAWGRYSELIEPTEITPKWLDTEARLLRADLIIWTLPLIHFCVNIGTHRIRATEVWAKGDAPDLNSWCPVTVPPWTVELNGEDSPRWYRAANVYGHKTAEWPIAPKPPIPGLARVLKPVDNDCSCWGNLGGTPVLRVGRYGRWTKGELSHQAFERVAREL